MRQNLQIAEHFTRSTLDLEHAPPPLFDISVHGGLINPPCAFPLKEPSSGLIYDPISRFSPGHASAYKIGRDDSGREKIWPPLKRESQ